MSVKKHIPVFFKKPLWWLFKAPQRKLGFFTFGIEVKGRIQLFFDRLKSIDSSELQPITICVSNKNRTEALLKYVLPSILQANQSHLINLSVYDAGSEDASMLEQSLREALGSRLTFQSTNQPFARGQALNRAVANSNTELLFITDADISLPKDIVKLVNTYAQRNRIWFPVCSAYTSPAETHTAWYIEGKGLMACTRTQFATLNGYDESFTSWGGEDTDLWMRCWSHKYFCFRTHEAHLLHHWHEAVAGSGKKW